MSELLARDAAALHRAMQSDEDVQNVPLHRSTIQYVAGVVDALLYASDVGNQKSEPADDAPADEASPAEAARILGVSRPYVRKLMDQGELPFRMVGSHHRIPLAALHEYRDAERVRRTAALDKLADLQNELGLLE